ncbi:hypothetical protein [Cryobacterium arcticum]|uniref:DUF4253 domain-containing protein n=1 Tax=Cryobacterium arcticum TaxID=670052 RepID=A0A317ZKT0_9MICO|nr:hypothetical protein [Cryobacterium arcticum]PXA67132.1 hypothetical protein CTB96_10225 [Cryobacterium arcticum]
MQIMRSIESINPRYRSVFTRLTVHHVATFENLLDLIRNEQATHPDISVFITLDDLGQALYTSMHATESDELEIVTDDLDFLGDTRAEEARELRQFAHTSAQLAAPGLRRTWADLRGTREGTAETVDALVAMNDNPVEVLDDVILVMHVPADDETAAIAAVPNGYFSDDWNIFENHAVAQHLANGYGYRPLGIGASWIGFVREAPLAAPDAKRLVADLTEIYGAPEAPGWESLGAVLTRQATLFLGYTDGFEE